MTGTFIFIFLDDSTLDIVNPKDNLSGIYEGIDVANGEYAFFDGQLRKMLPRFTKPSREGKLLGFFRWIESGEYELLPEASCREEFLARLSNLSLINPNQWFKTVDEVREYVQKL